VPCRGFLKSFVFEAIRHIYLLNARQHDTVSASSILSVMARVHADHNACEVCWFHDHPPLSDPQTAVAIIPRVHRLESWCNRPASVIIYPHSKLIVVNGTLYRCPACDLPSRIFDGTQWDQALREATDAFVGWDICKCFFFSIERSDGTFHLPSKVYQVYTLFEANVRTLQKCVRRRLQKKRELLFEAFANLSHIRLGNRQSEYIRRVCGIEEIMRKIFHK
jgi:hypothetical protein